MFKLGVVSLFVTLENTCFFRNSRNHLFSEIKQQKFEVWKAVVVTLENTVFFRNSRNHLFSEIKQHILEVLSLFVTHKITCLCVVYAILNKK